MSSVSKPRVRHNRHKQGLNLTLEKLSADFRKKMKKIEYQAPEMEIMELNLELPLLTISTGESSDTTLPSEEGGHTPNF